MNDPIDIQDLRPAPRTAPPLVLWAMLAIALGGVALLVVPATGEPNAAIASAFASADTHATPLAHAASAVRRPRAAP